MFLFRDFPKMFSASLTPYLETRWERIFHFHQTKFSCSRNEKSWIRVLKFSCSGLVRQRVRLGGVQDPDQLELLAGEPSRPLHHQDHLPPSTQDGVTGVRLVQPYPQGGRRTLYCNCESRTTANKKDCKISMSFQLFCNLKVIQTSNCFLVFSHFLDLIKIEKIDGVHLFSSSQKCFL